MTTFVGIDPGKATGVAFASLYNGYLVRESFISAEIPTRDQAYDELKAVLNCETSLVVFAEKFTISGRTTKTKVQYDSLYLLGFIEGLCHVQGIDYWELTPAESKGFATDAKLRRLGWYDRTPDGHANDAARLILTGVVKHYPEVAGEIQRRIL